METPRFNPSDHVVESRLAKLTPAQAQALEGALSGFAGATSARPDAADLPFFLLPMAEAGLTEAQIRSLTDKVPAGYPLDHREIYFDFRLGRWIRHVEPPTVSDLLDEYLDSAETPTEGLAYLRDQWRDFLKRHGFA